jgi:hypothetical protein
MKKMLIVFCALALISAVASAQSKSLRSSAAQPNVQAPQPAYCAPCLFYSGDFDPNNAVANALFNANTTFGEGQAYVAIAPAVTTSTNKHGVVKVSKTATVTQLVFNEFATGLSDFTGSTYDIRTDLAAGYGGTEVKTGTCASSSATATGRTAFSLNEYSFSCTFAGVALKAGTEYWVNVTPNFNDGDYAYLSDSEDQPPLNAFNSGDGGLWGNVGDGSYFQGPATFGVTWGEAANIGDYGMDEFSIAVVGTY